MMLPFMVSTPAKAFRLPVDPRIPRSPAAGDDDLLIDDATSTDLPITLPRPIRPPTTVSRPVITPAFPPLPPSPLRPARLFRCGPGRPSQSGFWYQHCRCCHGIYHHRLRHLQGEDGRECHHRIGDSTGAGKKAFKYVSSIAIYSAGNITTDTVTVGTGEVLGLPYTLTGTGDFFQASLAGVLESTHPT